MNISTGVDIIEIQRIKRAIEKDNGFLSKIYTSHEIEYCESKGNQKYKSYAVRFAAKEAYVKAIGTGFDASTPPRVIEVINNKNGKPYLYANKIKVVDCDVSLSHSELYAVAYVVICKKD